MSCKKMFKTLTNATLFVIAVIMEVAYSYNETCIGEFCFTTPGHNELKNFSDAKSWCTAKNFTLAVVNDSYTQTSLAQFLNTSNITTMAYINMKLHEGGNTWFLVNGSQYGGQIGNQNNITYNLYCCLKKTDGLTIFEFLVTASNPSDLKSYICYYEGTKCFNSTMNNAFSFNSRCYVKYENESSHVTWYQARKRCIDDGGDLAQFQPDSNNTWLGSLNKSYLNPLFSYWVGIRYNDWQWKIEDNGDEIEYFSWARDKPNNYNYSCVCVDPNGSPRWSWADCDCSLARPFICRRTAPPTTVIATTSMPSNITTAGPSLNTGKNNSSVQENDSGLSKSEVIGLGAGIAGGCFILLIVVVIAVAVVITRRKRKSNQTSESRISTEENNEDDNYEIENTEVAGSRGKDLYTQVQKPPRNPASNSRGKDVYAQVNKPPRNTATNSRSKDVYAEVNKPPRNPASNDVYAKVVSGENKQQTNNIETSPEIVYSAPKFAEDPTPASTNSAYEVANRVKDPDAVPSLRGQTHSIFPGRQNNAYANDDVDD